MGITAQAVPKAHVMPLGSPPGSPPPHTLGEEQGRSQGRAWFFPPVCVAVQGRVRCSGPDWPPSGLDQAGAESNKRSPIQV